MANGWKPTCSLRYRIVIAQYMLRAPFSLEKMSYDPESRTVIYRSRMHKTLMRNFQIMHGADLFQ